MTEIYREVAVLGDPGRIRQILRNLITNALRYGGEHVTIETTAGPLSSVVVRDDGDGIPLEQREEIFAPYHRVGGRGDTVLGSLGLGLTISRQLARLMGGDLTYQYIDGHSVFTLYLRPAPRATAGLRNRQHSPSVSTIPDVIHSGGRRCSSMPQLPSKGRWLPGPSTPMLGLF